MPNWCSNFVEIEGLAAQIADLAGKIIVNDPETGDPAFDFNGILPMPEELLFDGLDHVCESLRFFGLGDDMVVSECEQSLYGCHYKLLEEQLSLRLDWKSATVADVKLLLEREPHLQDPCKINTAVLRQARRNIECCGALNWYDWRIRHWGTKWNAGECHAVTVTETSVFIDFDTAWSPPEGIYRAICQAYPELSLNACYMELGMYFAGRYHNVGRDLFDSPCEDSEVQAFCIENFGMDAADFCEDDEEL